MSKELAKKGRLGDTEIRKVDGKPAHVNKAEAHLIDRKGKLGEILVKAHGSGTTNPETGLKEYADPYTIAMVIGTLISAGANIYSAWKAGKIADDQFDRDMEQYNSQIQQTLDQNNLDWYTLQSMYGNQIFDIDGDGIISQNDYDNAPNIIKEQMAAQWPGSTGAEPIWKATGYSSQSGITSWTKYEFQNGQWVAVERKEKNEMNASDIANAYSMGTDLSTIPGGTDFGDGIAVTFGEMGDYQNRVFKAQEQQYRNQLQQYNDLKDALTEQMGFTPTEDEIRKRYNKLITEGDPELEKILNEKANLALGTIRQQGRESVSQTMGRVIGQNLEGSIIAQDLIARTDRQTLKQLSETARQIAAENKNAQLGVRRQAQSDLDRLNLSVDARKRAAITNIAGLTKPMAPIQQPMTWAYPTMGLPGQPPINTGQYGNPQLWSAIGGGLTTIGGTGDLPWETNPADPTSGG